MSDPLPADAIYGFSQVTELACSPDGERAAFVADEFDAGEEIRRRSLYVVPTDGSDDPYRLTRASDASQPEWSPDGTKLGFVASRERDADLRVGRTEDEGEDDGTEGPDDEDEEPDPQAWIFDLSRGGDARQVTDREEGVREFDWGPNGERIVVSARDPTDEERAYLDEREEGGPIETERLQHKFDGQGWLDAVTSYLFVVDVDTREERRLDEAYGGGALEPMLGLQPRWAPSDRIAFLSNRTERPDDSCVMDLYTVEPDGSALRKVTDSDLMVSDPRWSPDGERIGFVAGDPDNWYVPSEVFAAERGGEPTSLSPDLDRTVARMAGPRWVDDGTILALFADEGNTRLVRLYADGAEPERVFERQGRHRSMGLCEVGGGRVVALVSDPASGSDVHAMDVEDVDALSEDRDPLTRLTALNDDLAGEYAFPSAERISFESDGAEIEAIVYHPPEFDPGDPIERPLVVSIHGGPMSYDAPIFDFSFAYWTTRGYLVMRPNYRGSTSYGREFCETLRGRWGTEEVADILAGTEALVERGWADPDRLFATGFSYGGISTAYLVTRSDLYAAAAAEHGIYDLRSSFGTDDTHKWLENDFGLPWEDPEAYDAASSITDVGDVDTPLLLTAGGEDWRCPPSQSEQLYVSVKKRGVPARLVVYPDEHHDVGDPDRAIHRLEELAGWFERFDPEGGASD